MSKVLERLLGQVVDKFVDVDNFRLRPPYEKAAIGVAKKGYQKFKKSKAAEVIAQEPTIAAFKKVLMPKKKPLRPEDLADSSLNHDFYHVLNVERDADTDTIKKAFRAAAAKYHPDKNKNNPANIAIFKKLQQAYDVLSDKTKRGLYDEFGEISLRMNFDPAVARNGGYGSY